MWNKIDEKTHTDGIVIKYCCCVDVRVQKQKNYEIFSSELSHQKTRLKNFNEHKEYAVKAQISKSAWKLPTRVENDNINSDREITIGISKSSNSDNH